MLDRPSQPRVHRAWLAAATALLAAALAVVYAPALGGGFTSWDDSRFISDNPLFHGPIGAYVVAAITRVQFEAYQPLHLLVYLPDRLLWAQSALGFHILNLVLFLGAVVMIGRLAARVAAPWAAAVAATMFALHPMCVEPVAWITSRKDVFALLLVAIALYVEDKRGVVTRPGIVGPLVFAAAVLTKSAMVAFPLVLAAWLLFVRRAALRNVVVRVAPYAVLAVAAAIVVYVLWRNNQLIRQSRPVSAIIDVPATIGFYISRVIVPFDLAPIYPAAPSLPGATAPGLGYLAAITGVLAVTVILTWRRLGGLARFAAVGFAVALLPVANIVPVYFRYADRYAFLAMAVLVPPVAAALERLYTAISARVTARRAAAIVGCGMALLVAGEAVGARTQAAAWSTSEALWAHSVAAQPRAYLGHLKYGEVLRDNGHFDRATGQYRAAIRLAPERVLGYVGLLYCYATETEAAGGIPAGSSDRWLRALGPALQDPAAFWRLSAEMNATSCHRCAASLALVGVRRFGFPDSLLLDHAEAAVAAHRPDLALVYLDGIRDRAAPRYVKVNTSARELFQHNTRE